ncbi:uncharacterized protein L969DRAFT_67256 [Mixia osmundae IAM 14324]|uniref:FAD/NAD(P)-binding domain-containing protein n=1 Tax=Mixia osmundae (strain CBS 9802 / IAM 14324 / JCM 22182 / KY 12970) TaxID=764103 RepID=G7E1P7_MIXOS|nr:uncharacterized protein L969DRAFT_67256 [Mixia osmundae IAM 14324]KEI36707.1 hypothetical protein L969DRAFT_67256 [Mixia osmundae IAM 14324]GAA96757.1 hypothetical protein E5Q_03428 [Mixia osmundae IAM 14324]
MPRSEGSDVTAVELEHPRLSLSPKGVIYTITSLINEIVSFIYRFVQHCIAFVFAPSLPPPQDQRNAAYGHVAVIGAGVSGVSTAAHLIGNGFLVTLYDDSPAKAPGGVWARVNKTSGLQLNSMLYRFFPAVIWSKAYPHRDEVVGEVEKVWTRYGLDACTRWEKVTKVERHHSDKKGERSRWIINGDQTTVFDAVFATIGTCGAPKRIDVKNLERWRGKVAHSSQLDDLDLEGKRVIVLGSGASGVEAAETALANNAKHVTVLARSDKWIIPRNFVVDTLLALQPLGRQTPLSFIPEWLLRTFHYRDLQDISPYKKGVYAGTPIVNNSFLEHIRQGRVTYARGDLIDVMGDGVKFSYRPRESKAGDEGDLKTIRGDVFVLATGFERPSLDFLPKDLFPKESDKLHDYAPPNLYLQVFSTEDWSICLTNAAYKDAIATVGHVHIGIYARILMTFLKHPETAPSPASMKLWVDVIRWIKETAPAGSFEFFTFAELTIWFLGFHLLKLSRLPYFMFVLNGLGGGWPRASKQAIKTG